MRLILTLTFLVFLVACGKEDANVQKASIPQQEAPPSQVDKTIPEP